MATDGPVSRWNEPFYNASDERLLDSVGLMPSGAGAFAARSGRRPGPGLGVTFSDLTATVAPGAGVIYDPAFGAGGPWRFVLASSKQVTLDARPGTGLVRKDLIVARIYDSDSGAGTTKEFKIEVVKGTAAASPSKPALPALSLELGVADVASGGAVSFTPATARTVAAGGVLPVASSTERDALPSPYTGLAVWNEQARRLQVFDGTAWASFTPAGGGFIKRTGAGQSVGDGTSYSKLRTGTAKVTDDASWTYTSADGAPGQYEYTCVTPGTYRFVVVVQWEANATGRRGIGIFLNDNQQPEGDDGTPSGNYNFRQTAVYEDTFAAGDRVGARVLQTSGASRTITASAVSVARIGA